MEIVIVVSVPVFVLVGFGFFALRLRLAFFMFLERGIPGAGGLARKIFLPSAFQLCIPKNSMDIP